MNEMMKLMTGRRTYRRFDQSRRIPEEVIGEIIESARLSSSARNDQQLTFAVVENAEKVEVIFPMTHFAGALPKELGTPKDGEHPVLYILLLMEAGAKDPWIPVDAGIAAANMTMAAWYHGVGSCIMGAIDMAAWYHGVGSCIMGAIDRKAIREALAIPEKYEIHTAIAFGYPTHKSTVVPVGEDGKLKYYLDENRDYYVPKKDVRDISFRIR